VLRLRYFVAHIAHFRHHVVPLALYIDGFILFVADVSEIFKNSMS
jgi:hypothetical protein